MATATHERIRQLLSLQTDRRFEAIVVDWDGTRPDDVMRLRGLAEELCGLGLELAMTSGGTLDDVDGRLRARPRGAGRLLLCVNGGSEAFRVAEDGPQLVARVDGDAAGWLFDDLWRRGIHREQVLALPPDRALDVLEDQLRRRRRGDVPDVAHDPEWTFVVDGVDPELERVNEALLTIGDGRIGTSGSPVGAHAAARPRVLAAGMYDGEGPAADLVPCAVWTRIDGALPSDETLRRRLDLRTGLLHQELSAGASEVEAVLFSALAEPGLAVLRAQGDAEALASETPLLPVSDADARLVVDGYHTVRTPANDGGVFAAAAERLSDDRLERLAVYAADPDDPPDEAAALERLREAERTGFEELLASQRRAWADRWESADVRIEGDDELQRAVRFALFHLMASVGDTGEAAVGARGLTGPAYRGHVFWDADVFVLPFLAATHPPAARAMLEYRVRRLNAARAVAAAAGRAGARFPWESAHDGLDVTPPFVRDQTGRAIVIRTGDLEEHITADVAWGACCYAAWTGDEAFAEGPGRELLVETARYWASRIRVDGNGRGHIYGVIGPDEYHEPVDDNAFTNGMVRWNLRSAAEAAGRSGAVAAEERASWVRLADALVDGYDPVSGLYEQFAGFFRLEPIVIADVAPRRPIAADLLLGPERTAGAQVLKQADVLMLHHLLPDDVAPGSLAPNLDFYEPRTAHGSSLSPAVHASLLARAGRLDEALASLRLAARLDLDDLTGTTAGGLHLATMGGVWQALAFGFAGLRPRGDRLAVDPRLPPSWRALELRLRFRGRPLAVRIEHEGVSVHGRGFEVERKDGTWEVQAR